MELTRLAAPALLAALVATGVAAADPPPGHGHAHAAAPVRSHGVISGRVLGVDYSSATIIVASGGGRVAVAVTPSTSIFRGGGFASFADIGRGSRVDIDFSDIGGRLVAQIIRIH